MNPEQDRSISRRRFVGLGAAAAAGLAVGPQRLLAAAGADPFGGFRLGVQSYSFRGFTFDEAVKRTKALGLKYIEIYPNHVGHEGAMVGKQQDALKLLKDSGVQADSYGVVDFKNDEASARKVFEFAKLFGLRAISANPAKNSFDVLDKLCAEYKMPIAIHNHGPGSAWEKPEQILAAVKDHHPLIGICCDCGHYLRSGIDPVHAIQVMKGRVFGFHIKDFIDEKTEKSAGDGKLNIAAVLTEARAQKFDGACSLEYELDPKDPDAGMAKGVENFRKAVATLK